TGACTVTMNQARAVTATFAGGAAYALLVSTSANRASPVELNGFNATGNIYVFTSPESGASEVRFFLDDPAMTGSPFHTEGAAPWDFNATAGGGGGPAL